MKRLLISIAVALAAPLATLQAQPNSVLAPNARIKMAQINKTTPAQRSAALSTTLSAYLMVDEDEIDWQALQQAGAQISMRTGNMATIRVEASRLQALAQVPGVKHLQLASKGRQQLDKARQDAGTDLVLQGTSLSSPYTGKGVVIGIVDAGFDYGHKAFYDAQGNNRIKRVWEQSTEPTTRFPSPQNFGYGAEIKEQSEIEWAGGDIANNSHGTHVTCIAAGSKLLADGAFCGAAPDADIVLVSMGEASDDNVNFTNAIKYVFDYADEVGKPAVVNLSLGTHAGPHDGTSPFDRMADQLQGPGRLLVGSSGNFGLSDFHIRHIFAGETDAPLSTFLDFYYGVSTYGYGDVEVWADADMQFEAKLFAYNTFNKEVVAEATIDLNTTEAQQISLGNKVTGTITAAYEISPYNNKPHLLLSAALTGMRTNHQVGITIVPKKAGKVDIWADNIYIGLTSNDIEGFTAPTRDATIAEIGGTAKRILTVGAYTTRREYTLYRETAVGELDETVGDLFSASAYGLTADGRMKPEVCTPGCFIISAVSNYDNSGYLYLYNSYAGEGRYHLYGYMQGTSMAAPFATGTVASWLQACPTLTPEQLKEVIEKTSRHDDFTGNAATAATKGWGYGKIDALAGAKECSELYATGITGTTTTPAECMVALQGNMQLLFTAATSNATITLCNAGGSEVYRQQLTNVAAGTPTEIALPAYAPGIYVLKVQTEHGTLCRKLSR